MRATIVVGAAWGDEGKGKLLDYLGPHYQTFVRFNGGANAGHTICANGQKLALHLLPSAVLHPRKIFCLGPGTVIDPEELLKEILAVKEAGGLQDGLILVDMNAAVVMPEHKEADRTKNVAIGTTGRGIGPCYEDRVGRRGLKFADLLTGKTYRFSDTLRRLEAHVNFVDVSNFLHDELAKGNRILFEGAQGVLLDIEFGTYPYVTSSSTLPQNAALSLGLPMQIFSGQKIIGVTKAYTTRVGEGPFPTELKNDLGEFLRKTGKEFGATTGRPRRCGWLDIAALRYAVRISGINRLALTKIDVLSNLPKVKFCIGYSLRGTIFEELPIRANHLIEAEPVYEEVAGWPNFQGARYFSDLPTNAQNFIKRIEELVGVKIALVSTGAGREDSIIPDGKLLND